MSLADRPPVNAVHFENGALIAAGKSAGAVGVASAYADASGAGIVVVRGTTYTEPTAAAQREVVSSNANDTSAGTGARTLRIIYYDGSGAGPLTTDVTLNGTTAVATSVSDIRFVEYMHLLTVGSNGTNAGTITLRLLSAGATIGTIAISDGRTYWAHHYVAASRTCQITELIAGMTHAKGTVFLRAISMLTANAFERQITGSIRLGPQGAGAAAAPSPLQPSLVFPFRTLYINGPARVAAYVDPDGAVASNIAQVSFGFMDV